MPISELILPRTSDAMTEAILATWLVASDSQVSAGDVLAEVETEKAQMLEEELIKAHNSVKKGYNDTYTGGGGDIWINRRDTKEYMEWISHMKEISTGKNNGMYGKTHSDESKDKLKERAKGRFTLDWYKERNGDVEGERLYEERRVWLKSRNLKKDENGRFLKAK